MQGDGIIVFVKWCIIAIGISLFMPISLEDNRSSKATTMYVDSTTQMDSTLYSQPQNQTKPFEKTMADTNESLKMMSEDMKDLMKTGIITAGETIAMIMIVCIVGLLVILLCVAGIGILIYCLVIHSLRSRNNLTIGATCVAEICTSTMPRNTGDTELTIHEQKCITEYGERDNPWYFRRIGARFNIAANTAGTVYHYYIVWTHVARYTFYTESVLDIALVYHNRMNLQHLALQHQDALLLRSQG